MKDPVEELINPTNELTAFSSDVFMISKVQLRGLLDAMRPRPLKSDCNLYEVGHHAGLTECGNKLMAMISNNPDIGEPTINKVVRRLK